MPVYLCFLTRRAAKVGAGQCSMLSLCSMSSGLLSDSEREDGGSFSVLLWRQVHVPRDQFLPPVLAVLSSAPFAM